MSMVGDDVTRLRAEVARLSRVEQLMQQLLAVTGQLASAPSREDISRIVNERGLAAVGASYGAMWLVDASRTRLELAGSSSGTRQKLDRWASIPLDLDAPMPQVVRTGEPLYVESMLEYEARFPISFARIRDTITSPTQAYALLPLVGGGEVVGAMSATYERGEELDASLRTFLEILASQCGQALERVRAQERVTHAYREEREAHALAEEATRAREEILAVVSHDLRNPLGTILIGASTLAAGIDNPRVRTIADRITRQTERMSRLLEDLVDFAGLQAGGFAIARRVTPPSAIVTNAAELCAPLAEERDLRFTTLVEPDLPPVSCDAPRVVQVFANLFANALKATPKNGAITLGVRAGTEFFLRDTGPGFAPDEAPHVFERHWRSKQPMYKGAGLRLAIAKGIVDAHGGRIWLDSGGGGSTFSFTLT
jgi:signal transduction histidine kinase